MATRGEEVASQFEKRAQDALAVVETLSDAEWAKVTEAEGWLVGVTAHHLAGAFEAISGMITGILAGQPPQGFSMGMLDAMNAQHAREAADCTRAETVAMFQRGILAGTHLIRGLTDEQLEHKATVFSDAPPMTVAQLIDAALIHHIDDHLGSIRRTIGR